MTSPHESEAADVHGPTMWHAVTVEEELETKTVWLMNMRSVEGTGYVVNINNGDCMWQESLTSENLTTRMDTLNPVIEYEDNNTIVDMLKVLVTQSESKFTKKLVTDTKDLELQLMGVSGGVAFSWHFTCSLVSSNFQMMMDPLKEVVSQLLKERSKLIEVIRAKELEIFEYEESGAKLLRSNLKTKVFKDDDEWMLEALENEEEDEGNDVMASLNFHKVQRRVRALREKKSRLKQERSERERVELKRMLDSNDTNEVKKNVSPIKASTISAPALKRTTKKLRKL